MTSVVVETLQIIRGRDRDRDQYARDQDQDLPVPSQHRSSDTEGLEIRPIPRPKSKLQN